MLAAAKERAIKDGVAAPESKQRHGDLLESLQELQTETRLLVIGRQGESSGNLSQQVGSQLESVIRIMHRPILVTPASFQSPRARCWHSMAALLPARVWRCWQPARC